jgi:hypothetical protein
LAPDNSRTVDRFWRKKADSKMILPDRDPTEVIAAGQVDRASHRVDTKRSCALQSIEEGIEEPPQARISVRNVRGDALAVARVPLTRACEAPAACWTDPAGGGGSREPCAVSRAP